jgi:hypothetical protein
LPDVDQILVDVYSATPGTDQPNAEMTGAAS